ncbi:MAG: S1/P1 nuclease [Acidobacteriaceae bacterium]|nr:S1/P1 nuclease [Acidobacteriaceae bacterium]
MWANNIRGQYTRQFLAEDLRVTNAWTMATKLYDIAVKQAYGDIRENSAPSQDYLKTRFETCKKLMALAGYRLADYLNAHMT